MDEGCGRAARHRVVRSTVRPLLLGMAVLITVLGVAACTADPPPPVRDTATPQTATEYPDGKTIYVATDSIGTGFNPHLGADQNPVTTAIAAMTLPSAFLPVQTPDGVRWHRNDALVTSAEVTSTQPFTVTYHIHTNAQWSDGLPVTGDDFNYLWQQMSRQPNVVAPAGYRLIDSVTSSAGSKVVEVRFAQPYPQWRELFTNLLPSHVLRGTPAGFQTGMDSGKPVSAGPFQIFSLDPTRDEVRLIRNDRYWMTPSKLDQVVLRRAGTDSQMVDSIRSGGSALATVGAGPATAAELTAVPGLTGQRSPTSRALTISVNARTPVMNRVEVRRAVLGMIDTNLASLAGAGEGVIQQYANTVYAPSDPGYFPVNRPRPSSQAIDDLLASAGYRRGAPASGPPASGTETSTGSAAPSTTASRPSDSSSPGGSPSSAAPSVAPVPDGVIPYEQDGHDLVVRVGAISGDPRSMSAAANIVDQLRSAGVRAGVVSLPNSDLYGVALTDSRVDLVVGWTGLGVPPEAALASQVDCDQPKPGTAPSLSTPPTPTSVAPGQDASGATTVYASNTSGVCDPALITLARQALSADDPAPMLAEAEPLLAGAAIYLPLYQDSMLVGVTRAVTGVPLAGPIQTSIYGTAATWDLK
ncbi:ABC transporter family substrate-binding protein [Gordonia sp. DT219]|uniref:ABC transporter family substrate-binding protein n=1 Tax=Gordonia sp. DT219 TaxID=3416658 RepID=UPI003CEE14B9